MQSLSNVYATLNHADASILASGRQPSDIQLKILFAPIWRPSCQQQDYSRHVKLAFGVVFAFCLFLYGFCLYFEGVFFCGVRATILNLKSHYTRHVKLDFGVSVALCLFLYGFAYVLKVFSFLGSGNHPKP